MPPISQLSQEQRGQAALNRSRARYEQNASQIRVRNSEHIANVRANNPDLREESRAREATARVTWRRSERIRNIERIRDAEGHAHRRQDPGERQREQVQDTAHHATRRTDPEYRIPERIRDMEARANRREDPQERRREQTLSQVLGEAASVRAVTEETNIEIRDLDDLTTKDELVAAIVAQMSTQEEAFRVKSLRPGYSGTQVATLGAGPDLASKILSEGRLRIGWTSAAIWVFGTQPENTFAGEGFVQAKVNGIWLISCYLPPRLTLQQFGRTLDEVAEAARSITDVIVIIKITVPLISTEVLHIYKLTPIPAANVYGFHLFKIKTPFIAINNYRDKFVDMTTEDIANCYPKSINDFICHSKQSMFSTEMSCEMQLFHNKTDTSCHLEITNKTFIWQEMHKKNQWIFATRTPIKLSAVCTDGTSDIWLRNTGLLTARAGCTIRNSLITVISQTGIETSTLISYARFGEIDGNNTTIKRQNTTSSKTNKFGYTKLLDLQRDLAPNRRLRLPHRLEMIKHHHIAMYIGLTFIIIILTIHWVRKWYKGDKRPQQVQVPAVAMRKTDTTSRPPFTINIDDC
ncbi:uncharacterized protein Dana_GF26386 [Drosophila ananassae]|uniref:Uncharacterized protein n=1 Tax=Drosophila ananassae TaxID=7217 RepID=A0A0N8NZX1_DROAN|nr:uncharacterized protein Dana_GF26386 [Drosophila ananassae]